MSTPEQPDTPQLTRKQLREIRNTASVSIISDVPASDEPVSDAPDSDAPASDAPVSDVPSDEDQNPTEAPEQDETPAVPPPVAATPVSAASIPRAAEPVEVHEAPVADSSVDLEAPALTRRQARQQERIRTASVPVISADMAAAYARVSATPATSAEEPVESVTEDVIVAEIVEPDESADDSAATSTDEPVEDSAHEESDSGDVILLEDETTIDPSETDADAASESDADTSESVHEDAEDAGTDDAEEAHAEPEQTADANDADQDDEDRTSHPVVAAAFGAELLAGESVKVDLPPSFDQLLSSGSTSTGTLGAANALILSQTPDTGPLVSPVNATGEVLITGTFNLPDRYGSTGTVPGTADGHEADSVLLDGELPASSSPTPISASAAISTIKSADEVIRPPAPEKGSRLMMVLAITAGVLAVALAGVLILAFVTGVFQ